MQTKSFCYGRKKIQGRFPLYRCFLICLFSLFFAFSVKAKGEDDSRPDFECFRILGSLHAKQSIGVLEARLRAGGIRGDLLGSNLMVIRSTSHSGQSDPGYFSIQFQRKRRDGVTAYPQIFISYKNEWEGEENKYHLEEDLVSRRNREVLISRKETLFYMGEDSRGAKWIRFVGSPKKYFLREVPSGWALDL